MQLSSFYKRRRCLQVAESAQQAGVDFASARLEQVFEYADTPSENGDGEHASSEDSNGNTAVENETKLQALLKVQSHCRCCNGACVQWELLHNSAIGCMFVCFDCLAPQQQ